MNTMRGKRTRRRAGRGWAASAALLCLVVHSPSPAQEPVKAAHVSSLVSHMQALPPTTIAATADLPAKCQPRVLAASLRKHLMPEVRGCRYAIVVAGFIKSGLRAPAATTKPNHSPAGEIFRQYPPAGGNLMPDTQVQLFIPDLGTAPTNQQQPVPAATVVQVPQEPMMAAVPAVAGFAQAAAVGRIEASHLQADFAGREVSAQPLNSVSRTLPPAFSSVALGTGVRYWLSLGPAVNPLPPSTPPPLVTVTVPPVTGDTSAQAVATPRKSGPAAGEPIAELTPADSGPVSRQYPLAGSSLPHGGVVLLWRPHAWSSVSGLAVILLLLLVSTVGGVLVHIRRERLRTTRKAVSMRASIVDQGESAAGPVVLPASPVIALRARLQPGEVRFDCPVTIERQEMEHD